MLTAFCYSSELVCKCNQPSWRRHSSVFRHGAYFCGVAPQQITPRSQQQHHHYADNSTGQPCLTNNPVRPSRPVYDYFILCLKGRGERMQEYEVCLIDPMSWRKSREKTGAPPCPSHLSPTAGRQERKEQTSHSFSEPKGPSSWKRQEDLRDLGEGQPWPHEKQPHAPESHLWSGT